MVGPSAGWLAVPLPRLCVLDRYLPDVDGIYVLRTMKQDAVLSRVPVVVFGKGPDRGWVDTAYSAGAASCITVPESGRARSDWCARLLEYWFSTSVDPAVL